MVQYDLNGNVVPLKLCECGCGEPVAKLGDRFINHHQNRGKDFHKSKPEAKLCMCGCGKLAEPGNDYINHHHGRGEDNGMYGKLHSPETLLKMSKKLKGKYVGENAGNWKGGLSYEPYCESFNNKLKQQIRNQYDNCDFISGLSDFICNVLNGKVQKLCIHHVDYDKMQGCDGSGWKLVPLSRFNHTKTNTNREFWERLICYALEYDETYYNEELIDVWRIKWKQTTRKAISNSF